MNLRTLVTVLAPVLAAGCVSLQRVQPELTERDRARDPRGLVQVIHAVGGCTQVSYRFDGEPLYSRTNDTPLEGAFLKVLRVQAPATFSLEWDLTCAGGGRFVGATRFDAAPDANTQLWVEPVGGRVEAVVRVVPVPDGEADSAGSR